MYNGDQMTVRMNNKTLLWLAIVAIVALITYGAFSNHLVSEIDNKPSINTTNGSVESESIAKNNTGNVTNQSTMAIPLEKPPFIE